MKSFIQFLSEMSWYTKTPKRPGATKINKELPDYVTYHSTMDTGHKVYKMKDGYHVRSPDDKHLHFTVWGDHFNGVFHADQAARWNDSPSGLGLKVYHHILADHPIMSSSFQNSGSKNLWDKLKKHKDVEVVGYDISTGKELPHTNVNITHNRFNRLMVGRRGDYGRLLARKRKS